MPHASFSPIVHHMTKLPGTEQYAITRVTPLTRLSCLSEAVYLQNGMIFSVGGDLMTNPPAWVFDEMRKMSEASLREVGFERVPEQPKDAPAFLDHDLAELKAAELEQKRRAALAKANPAPASTKE